MKKSKTSKYRRVAGLILYLFVFSSMFAQTIFFGLWGFSQEKTKPPEGPAGGPGGGPEGPVGPMGGGKITVTQDAKTLFVSIRPGIPNGPDGDQGGPGGEMKMTKAYDKK